MLRLLFFPLLWLLIAPAQLGGSMVYLIISGNSMEPGFFRGDLAVARVASDYQVNDIVVYQHPRIGPVFHRIVGLTEGLYDLQGDNNYWEDSYHPSTAEISGRFLFKIPFLGKSISSLRSPENLAYFSVGASALLLASVVTGREQDGNKRKQRAKKRHNVPKVPTMNLPIRLQDVFLFLLLLTLGAIIFGVFAFIRPTSIELPSSNPYEHSGVFSYSASVPASIYGSDTLKSGDPIFRRISDHFDVTFDYQLIGSAIEAIEGSYLVQAKISASNGWSRIVEIEPQQEFSGDQLSIQSRIDLDYLQSFVDNFAEETGIMPNQYLVDIQPVIEIRGRYADDELEDTFSPILGFVVNELQMQLKLEGQSLEDLLFQSQNGTIFDSIEVDNNIPFFGSNLNIHTARLSAIVLSALFAGFTISIGLRITYLGRQPEADRIHGLYQRLLIPVSGVEAPSKSKLVEVESIEHLLRIAQQEGVSILEEEGNRNLHFYVQGTAATYHTQVRK